MSDEHGHLRLHSTEHLDPIWRLGDELPAQWRGPVLGRGIENWASITENDWPHLDLSGLPDPFAAEQAWMAHWAGRRRHPSLGVGDGAVGQHDSAGRHRGP